MSLIKYLTSILLLFVLIWAFSRVNRRKGFQTWIHVLYIFLSFLLMLELGLNIFFRVERGQWIFELIKHPNNQIFEKHPYLVASNKKNIDREFNGKRVYHNRFGQRSPDYSDEVIKSSVKIAAIGGSTTYGVGVHNKETWPYILDSLTGEDTIVLNFSVPGHSTIENIITASLYLDEFQPDIIFLHVGLNDLRCSHVIDLKNDYSNFHEPHLFGSMGFCYLECLPQVSTIYYSVQVMQRFGLYPVCDFHRANVTGDISNGIDTMALSFYRNNLRKLIHMSEYYTNNVVVIPQILVEENVSGNGLAWWIPLVPANQLMTVLKAYNETSKEVADSAGVRYLFEVDNWKWKADDFVDPSHLNKEGNDRLAELIYSSLKDQH